MEFNDSKITNGGNNFFKKESSYGSVLKKENNGKTNCNFKAHISVCNKKNDKRMF